MNGTRNIWQFWSIDRIWNWFLSQKIEIVQIILYQFSRMVIYAYIYIIHVYIHMYVHVYISKYTGTYTYVYKYTYKQHIIYVNTHIHVYIYICLHIYIYIHTCRVLTPNQLLMCSSSAPPRPGICECCFYLGQMNPLKRPKFESKRTGRDSGFKYRVVSHRFRDPLWDSGIPSEIVVGKAEILVGNHRYLWGPGWLVRHKPSKTPQVFEHKL